MRRGRTFGRRRNRDPSNEEATFTLGCCPHHVIVAPAQPLIEHRVDVETKRGEPGRGRPRQIFVKLQSQATFAFGGMGLGAGRSSAAEAAANAMTARTSSSVRLGNSARMVAAVSPWAR